MRRLLTLCSTLALTFTAIGCAMHQPFAAVEAQTKSPLDVVLSQMDAASVHFTSAELTFKTDNFTKSIKVDAFQTGTLYIEHNSKGQTMGLIDYDIDDKGATAKSPSKIVAFDGSSLQVYSPGPNQVDVFKAGANQAKYNTFLTLGFGGSGKDLAAAWNITDQGPETLDGVKTEKLDLVSKDDSVTKTFTHVTLWVDPTRAIALKQIFYSRNGDTRSTTYTNIKLNTKIDKSHYNIPAKAQRIPHD